MNCPHCHQEMKNGRLRIRMPGAIVNTLDPFNIDWFAEEEFEKKGLIASFKRENIRIKPEGFMNYFSNSYYCLGCRKVFCEFEEMERQDPVQTDYGQYF